jgi:hypothetical protein
LNFSRVLAASASHVFPSYNPVVLLADERYTTREARQRLAAGERRTASLDAMSAVCLLERYFEDEGDGVIPAEACEYPPPKDLEAFDYSVVKRHIQQLYYTDDEVVDEGGGAARRGPLMKTLKFGRQKGGGSANRF